MIVSRGRSYIFVHIPKTGGTSLALALEGRAMKDDIMLGDTPKAAKRRRRVRDVETAGRLWKHSTLADIEGLVSREEIAGMFTFTLVRNPWDRVVSYYHWLREQGFGHPAVRLARSVPFADFLTDEGTQASLRDWPAPRYMTDIAGTERADVYIRIEHFEEDAAPLFQHLGFTFELPHVNPSPRKEDYRIYYTGHLKDVVADCCAEDIERFGYQFG